MFKNVYFLALSQNVSHLVSDNEQGPSGGGGVGVGGGLRKSDNIFIEREDDILLSCKQVFNC